jgi:hypothetical protein
MANGELELAVAIGDESVCPMYFVRIMVPRPFDEMAEDEVEGGREVGELPRR